jgi:hypothetical protein
VFEVRSPWKLLTRTSDVVSEGKEAMSFDMVEQNEFKWEPLQDINDTTFQIVVRSEAIIWIVVPGWIQSVVGDALEEALVVIIK